MIPIKSQELKWKKELEKYEQELSHKKEMEDIKNKYFPNQTFDKKIVQYSKILTTIILIFTIIINSVFFGGVILSGIISITDSAMESASSVLKIWDAGTVVFFCGYFAKALFETKFEKESDVVSQADTMIEKVKETVSNVIDNANN